MDLPREGEAALTDPLAHDAIKSFVTLQPGAVTLGMLTSLRTRSEARVHESPHFSAIAAERDQLRKERRENRLSLQEEARRQVLDAAHRNYAEREAAFGPVQEGVRFARLLLEDTKSKRIRLEPGDPLGARDPESLAVEREVLRVLADLIEVSTSAAAMVATHPK
jgi:hypothetical protein